MSNQKIPVLSRLIDSTVVVTKFLVTGSAVKEYKIYTQEQVSQRDRAAGWVSFGQKWKTGTGRRYFADMIGLPSTNMTRNRSAKLSNLMKNA